MQTNQLGSDGPDLSVIGYGAWEAGGTNWGPNESDDAVIAAMRAAIDAGINWIDTAEVYGKGVSESLVGRAVAGRRDEVVIASKVAPQPEGSGFRPEQVHRACEASLARLDIDVIDLYQLHWPDDQDTPIEDTWGAMVELQEARAASGGSASRTSIAGPHRAVPRDPSRGLAAAGVLHAEPPQRGADPLVR